MKDLSPEAIILKEIVKPEKIEETHISYAMITDDYVYKLKKPVDFGFLDYRLSKSRRGFCLLEKELNSRFSEDVYLDVLKIVKTGKEFKLVPYTNTMFAIDYVLKMKRIKDENFFNYKLEKGEIDEEIAFKIGKDIAKLFEKINTPAEAAEEYGSYDVIKYNCEENFQQTEKYKGNLIPEKYFDFIKTKTMDFLEKNRLLFEKRVKHGFVKDGHGDLRIDHVYFNGDKIGLLDCIEFNKRFRFNDVVSEIAFLSMELDIKKYTDISDAVLKGFFDIFDDEDSVKLLNFYKCYRAFVRAKVTCFMLEEKGKDWDGYDALKGDLDNLIDAAFIYALNMDRIKNFVFYGVMASGKTKNAKRFSERFPVKHINTDVERKLLFGIEPEKPVKEDFNKGIYSYENSLKTYDFIAGKVVERNDVGRCVVVDGSFSRKEYFDILDSKNIRYYRILFFADLSEIEKRLERRARKDGVVSDGRKELLESQLRSFETKDLADLAIKTDGSVEENIEKIVDYIVDNEK